MSDIRALVDAGNPRVAILRGGEVADGARCVLLWVSRAQRATGNLAADEAVTIANRLGLPVVAAFCMTPGYPGATLRAWTFMAEGLAELPDAFNDRGIGWVLRSGDPTEVIPALAAELGAAAVVTDHDPLRTGRGWRAAVAGRLAAPLVQVDADVVVPTALMTKEEWAARTIRPKLQRALPSLPLPAEPHPGVRSTLRQGDDPLALLARFDLDRSVGPAPAHRGGRAIAEARLAHFVREILPVYDTARNQADRDGSSGMSAFLHFGQLGPLEIYAAVRGARDVRPEAVDAYLNELVVQRELAINFALFNPDYDRFEGIPEWGQKTLAAHAADPRPVQYDRATLERGETGDALWNACQRQLVAEGSMPNRLRMYWAKQFLQWTPDARTAFETAIAFNDRYFLDGRDANGYAGVSWSIGGRHDRPFPPQRPVMGLVRPMGAKGMRKYFDVDRYIAQVERAYPR